MKWGHRIPDSPQRSGVSDRDTEATAALGLILEFSCLCAAAGAQTLYTATGSPVAPLLAIDPASAARSYANPPGHIASFADLDAFGRDTR